MFELSHSTTLPTAPVEAWLISSSTVNVPDGDVMYIENRSPITRASDQTENVKLIIEF